MNFYAFTNLTLIKKKSQAFEKFKYFFKRNNLTLMYLGH